MHLHQELRFHLATDVHEFVKEFLATAEAAQVGVVGRSLEQQGFHFRVTRELDAAKAYLRARYADDPDARFGLVASARDSDLPRFGVPNDFQSTSRVQNGPWFAEGDDDPRGRSCRTLQTCVTEFACQGLELDAVLLAWGSDLIWKGGDWSVGLRKRYQRPQEIKDARQLRINAYRVLLTRGRDATVVFVPPMPLLDATYDRMLASGFRDLNDPITTG